MTPLYERIGPYLSKDRHEAPDKYLFICEAVLKATMDRKISSAEVGWLRETLSDRLGRYATLREYVVRAIRPDLSHLNNEDRNKQFQAFRHRWLQHLCEEYECQAVFDKVVKHLLTQNRRSYGHRGCAYRSKAGDMCAVGCLISDEAYDSKIEGRTVRDYHVLSKLAKSGVPTYERMQALLTDLQGIHDHRPVDLWKLDLRILAASQNLTWKDEHEAL